MNRAHLTPTADGDRTGSVAEITVLAEEYAYILRGMTDLRDTPNGQ